MCLPIISSNWWNIHEMCGAVLLRAVQTDPIFRAIRILWENESHDTRGRRVGFAKWWYILIYTIRKIFVLVGKCCGSHEFHSCSFIQLSLQWAVQSSIPIFKLCKYLTYLKRKLFIPTSAYFLLISEKWELLHPLRLACLTPWASGVPRKGLGNCTSVHWSSKINRPNLTQQVVNHLYLAKGYHHTQIQMWVWVRPPPGINLL